MSLARVLGRCAAVLGGAALAVLLLAPPASAHAALAGSDPAAGAELASAPQVAELRFTEDIAPRQSTAGLVDGTGRPVKGTRTVARGGDRLLVRLPPLANGTYGLVWQVLAEDDGHATSGVVVFTVGGGGQAPALAGLASASSSGPLDVARRWLGLGLLSGVIGAVAVLGLVLGGGSPVSAAALGPARRRILSFAATCAALGVAAGILDLAAVGRRSGAPGLGNLLAGTRWGQLWLAREALLLALAVLLAAARRMPRLPVTALAAPLVLAVVATESLASHAAAAGAAAVAAVSLHILTATTWIGALPALALLLWPLGAGGADRSSLIRALRGRFSALAAVSVGLAVATGLYSAGREIDSVDSLVTTPYGRALLVKAGLVLAVGGLGVANAARLHGWAPRLGAMSRRHLSAEVAAGALVLLTAGVLAETAPPRDVPPPAPPPAAVTRTAVAGDLVVAVSVTPNRPGVNAFTVVAASSRRPAPAPVSGVTLRITEPSGIVAVPLRAVGPGRYFGTARIGEAGDLQLSAVIERGRATIAVPVTPRLAPAVANRPSAPPRPLAPITNVLALVLLTAGAAGGWFVVRTRSRQRPAPTVQAPPRVTASAP